MEIVQFIDGIIQDEQGALIVSVFVFLSVVSVIVAFSLVLMPVIQTRRALNQQFLREGGTSRRGLNARGEIEKLANQVPVEQFFAATGEQNRTPNSMRLKLFQAGFYGPNAVTIYNILRLVAVAVGFLLTYYVVAGVLLPGMGLQVPTVLPFLFATMIGLGFMTIPSIALDIFAGQIRESFRRSFPDFMDMMITCADAGMSLEAAVERVSSEFINSHKHLGIQVSILSLQLRAGKPLREGLRELSDRIGLDEARALAVLFRQSEELGTSLVEALRVYSNEMRVRRVLRAEENANALPVKMVIPLGLCIFPVVLMIIMLPLIVRMQGIFF